MGTGLLCSSISARSLARQCNKTQQQTIIATSGIFFLLPVQHSKLFFFMCVCVFFLISLNSEDTMDAILST